MAFRFDDSSFNPLISSMLSIDNPMLVPRVLAHEVLNSVSTDGRVLFVLGAMLVSVAAGTVRGVTVLQQIGLSVS